jgi:DNA recombination protein RmuC
MLAPFEKALKAMHENIHTMEKTRAGAYEGLLEQVKGLAQLQGNLQTQTGQLLQALRTPNVRGQWGEIQLRRLVEWSGMLPFCDFLDQKRIEAAERVVRPDLIINLPLGRTVVVDAKAPLQEVLEQEEQKGSTVVRTAVAKHLKLHIQALSKRNYARYVAQTPDFVLLFLPTEGLLIKALEADATLLDYCTDKGVLLATPMLDRSFEDHCAGLASAVAECECTKDGHVGARSVRGLQSLSESHEPHGQTAERSQQIISTGDTKHRGRSFTTRRRNESARRRR